ncbi:hypothetical protein [Enterococcus gallinarum]|uniref:hypothetical protein n=1 Tax=Enterococcus gallinarum TaxID=1353 RepID=UPI00280510C4|nr:hypothetical protein [Enterococcus gallinarum]MDT2685808.1 hypothetical protein [Enterococcus gallinarum]
MPKKATEKQKDVQKSLSYAQILEARAQRGEMTHQKQFVIKQAKKEKMKGV